MHKVAHLLQGSFCDSVAPMDNATGRMNQTYKRRADAIVHGLEDFRGMDGQLSPADEDFIQNSMRIAMKKPLTAFGGKGVVNTSRTLRAVNNVTLLGFTTLTSIGDLGLPIIRSGSFKSWVKGLHKWKTDPEYRAMLQNVGVAMENIIHERMLHLYGAPNGKGSHAFFNATFLTPWTDMNREIAGATAHEAFVAMQKKPSSTSRKARHTRSNLLRTRRHIASSRRMVWRRSCRVRKDKLIPLGSRQCWPKTRHCVWRSSASQMTPSSSQMQMMSQCGRRHQSAHWSSN